MLNEKTYNGITSKKLRAVATFLSYFTIMYNEHISDEDRDTMMTLCIIIDSWADYMAVQETIFS